MIFGVFSPTLYRTGGAELVAINMINALKHQGYKVIVSVNKKIKQKNVRKFYEKSLDIDAQLVFPFHLFPPYDHFNVYTIALQSYALRLKCDIFVDAYGFSPFPWADIVYFQGSSLLKRLSFHGLRNAFFFPYLRLFRSIKNLDQKIIFANSKFSADVLMKNFPLKNLSIQVLYPPVATNFFSPENFKKSRDNVCITVSRISPEKRLELIPQIAKLTCKDISFIVVGSCQSQETLYSILKLIREFKLTNRVKVLSDISRDHLRTLLWNSKAYLHTMKNEAFGIAPIEAMAAGCIPIVHDSGGPKEFIPENLRYKTLEEAATKIESAISNWSPEHAENVSEIATRFDEKKFATKFIKVTNSYVENLQAER